MPDIYSIAKACAALPFVKRRMLLRALFKTGTMTGWINNCDLAELLMFTLRIKKSEALKIDREYIFHDLLQGMEWLVMSARSRADILRDIQHVKFADEDLMKRLSSINAPVILSPLHMGAFPIAIAGTIQNYFRDRKVLLLRAREDNETNKAAISRLIETSAGLRILNIHKKDEYIDALRFARDGALIISFLDLPGSYGSPERTTLFNRPANLALGVESLSRIMKGCVVPLAVNSSLTGDIVNIGTPFEVSNSGAAERKAIASRISRNIENFVYANPAQWHMWPRLHEYRPLNMHEEQECAA